MVGVVDKFGYQILLSCHQVGNNGIAKEVVAHVAWVLRPSQKVIRKGQLLLVGVCREAVVLCVGSAESREPLTILLWA